MLALLLTGFDKSSIYQYGLFGFVLSGFDPVPRQDSAVVVVSLLSAAMSEQLNMLATLFLVCILQSIAANKGKQNVIIPKNQQV